MHKNDLEEVSWKDFESLNISFNLLKLVKADKNHVIKLTVAASLFRIISANCITLLVAPIGVQNGCKFTENGKMGLIFFINNKLVLLMCMQQKMCIFTDES